MRYTRYVNKIYFEVLHCALENAIMASPAAERPAVARPATRRAARTTVPMFQQLREYVYRAMATASPVMHGDRYPAHGSARDQQGLMCCGIIGWVLHELERTDRAGSIWERVQSFHCAGLLLAHGQLHFDYQMTVFGWVD